MKYLLLLLLTGCSSFSFVECIAKAKRLGITEEQEITKACEVDRLDALRMSR